MRLSKLQVDEMYALHAHALRTIDVAMKLEPGTARGVIHAQIFSDDATVRRQLVDTTDPAYLPGPSHAKKLNGSGRR